MGDGPGSHMKLGFLTGSMDGKPLSRLLPTRNDWSHYYQTASVGFSTSWLKAYDDHVVGLRFTPRDVDKTDARAVLARPSRCERRQGLRRQADPGTVGNTYREDRWICENQHMGVRSDRYNFAAASRTPRRKAGPRRFVSGICGKLPASHDRKDRRPIDFPGDCSRSNARKNRGAPQRSQKKHFLWRISALSAVPSQGCR